MALTKYRIRQRWYANNAARPVGVFAKTLARTGAPAHPDDTLLAARMTGSVSISGGAALAPPPNMISQMSFSLMLTWSNDGTDFLPPDNSGSADLLAVRQLKPRVEVVATAFPFFTAIWDHDGEITTEGMRRGNGTSGGPNVCAVLFVNDHSFTLDPAFGYNTDYNSFGELWTLWGSHT